MTFIIAEAGVNHDGKMEKALKLVDAAKEAGADAVKFQMFNSHILWGDDRIANLQLEAEDFHKLYLHCKDVGIEFMCTPFDVHSCNYLASLLRRVKVASGCITRKPLLRAARDTRLPVILSTGMSTWAEIREALSIVGRDNTTLLQCTSAYPCEDKDVNLKAMSALRVTGCQVGFSDHTKGWLASVAAAAKGAKVIEKHLTLNPLGEGPDHAASLDPTLFAQMVGMIRGIEPMLGTAEKFVRPCEQELHDLWRSRD